MKIAAYDDDGIWGVGDNEEQARAEAEGFMRGCFVDDPDEAQAQIDALQIAPISDDLLAKATEVDRGGKITIDQIDFPHHLVDGVLVFDAERDEVIKADGGHDDDDDDDDDDGDDFDGDDEPVDTPPAGEPVA